MATQTEQRTTGAAPAPTGTGPRPPARQASGGRPGRVSGALLTTLTWVIALAFFFPVFWMVLTAFKQEVDAYTETPKLPRP